MRRAAICLLFFSIPASVAFGENDALPPERTAALMQVPDGFKVTLFAGEPDVVKPIAMTLDDRGRLWVVESHSYPNWIKDGKPGRDRVLIFEDTKGTGHFDKRTLFLDNGTNLSGIALGFGGVWLCATPNLLFIPINRGEDKPAGPAEILLDGWSLDAKHNVFNSLVWGPDGWLYGCNGILATSKIGKPGTPDDKRVPFNSGVWRYHPTKKVFEVFAWGTTNPWGLDFDARGEMFITNCVIKHLFHVVQGGHYERMYGQDLNPHVYGLMQSRADHFHWAGGEWTTSRGGQGAHSDAGGGHAHAGCMIYQGDNWPDEYRGKVFMGNLHGNRINMDVLERQGSGYVAHHGKDFLTCPDPWFRPLAILYGPDGGVYVSDWHDTGECHNYDKVHPSGRIYKITYGKPKKVEIDLAKASHLELARLQSHKNGWCVHHARRVLQELVRAGKLDARVKPLLLKMLKDQKEPALQLQTLWGLNAIGGLDKETFLGLLDSKQEDLRGWAVRLVAESGKLDFLSQQKFEEMAKNEKVSSVRLSLASALQRLPMKQRDWIAQDLANSEEDAEDANVPPMICYGIEPIIISDPNEGKILLIESEMSYVRREIARRLAGIDRGHKVLFDVLAKRSASELDVLHGMWAGLRGRPGLSARPEWIATLRGLANNPNPLKQADRSHGRHVFNQTCAKCHVLFGEGGTIGPDLTGSERTHAEYLLTKLLDPSATVAKDYQLTIISTKSGRTVSGLVKEENDKVVTIQTANEIVRIAKADIDAREQSKQSMMPEGQLEKLSDIEVRDLFAYLAGSGQVPMPKKPPGK